MDSSQEGIVIVSMSNLFHIFDKERTAEIKKLKPNPNLNKAITEASKKGNKSLNTNLITDYSHEDKYYSGHSESSEKSPKKEDQYIIKSQRIRCIVLTQIAENLRYVRHQIFALYRESEISYTQRNIQMWIFPKK